MAPTDRKQWHVDTLRTRPDDGYDPRHFPSGVRTPTQLSRTC